MKNIFFLTFIFISSFSFAQVSFKGYLIDAEDNKLKNVAVNLYKGDEKISTKIWSKSFDYDLELEKYYTLELRKNGFVVKRISISTYEGDKGAEPFLVVMELIKNSEKLKRIDSD